MSTATALDFSAPFEALEVGTTFRTATREVTEQDVLAFATLTGDHHPQHVDPEWSASSAFGQQIAHGLLVLSCAAGLVPFDPERVVALRRLKDVVFKRPVAFGDRIAVDGAIEELRAPGIVTVRWNVRGDDDKLLVRAAVEVVWS